MSNELSVSTCTVDSRGWATCKKKSITKEQLQKYSEQLQDCLLKVEYSRYHSYDSSDDDRVEDSESSWDGVKYCEIKPMENSRHLIVRGDTVVGVVFFVRDNSRKVEDHAFLFDGSVQEEISMGYSASHSSDWTYINHVCLVKRGADGAPTEGTGINFEQSKMYPSI